jgi:mannose-6-phosphate isomerase-like protein (cupin superfamily)
MPELLRADAGASYLVITDVITVKVTCAESAELFTMLKGRGTLLVRTGASVVERRELGEGDTAHVAGGTPHTFRNFSDRPLRRLATFVPAQQAEAILAVAADVGMVVHDDAP